MKVTIFSALLLLAGAVASPQQNVDPRNLSTDFIRNLMGIISSFIQEFGLDSLEVNHYVYEYNAIPFRFKATVENLIFAGASNIVVNNFQSNILQNTFDFDVVLPKLHLDVGNSGLEAYVGTYRVNAKFQGNINLKNVHLVGQVHYKGSIITGIEIVGITLSQTSIEHIESKLIVTANGNDYSTAVNTFFNNTFNNILETYKNAVNALVAEIFMIVIRHIAHY